MNQDKYTYRSISRDESDTINTGTSHNAGDNACVVCPLLAGQEATQSNSTTELRNRQRRSPDKICSKPTTCAHMQCKHPAVCAPQNLPPKSLRRQYHACPMNRLTNKAYVPVSDCSSGGLRRMIQLMYLPAQWVRVVSEYSQRAELTHSHQNAYETNYGFVSYGCARISMVLREG